MDVFVDVHILFLGSSHVFAHPLIMKPVEATDT